MYRNQHELFQSSLSCTSYQPSVLRVPNKEVKDLRGRSDEQLCEQQVVFQRLFLSPPIPNKAGAEEGGGALTSLIKKVCRWRPVPTPPVGQLVLCEESLALLKLTVMVR